jgi:imidazolonepropionase-like amidohydrolase
MVRAGLTPAEALRSATALPARAFGLADRGSVAPGQRADLLLVGGDPTADITVTRDIRAIWCAGTPVTPAAQTARKLRLRAAVGASAGAA